MAWTDYYVDLAATGGSPDGSTAAPWQSYGAVKTALEGAAIYNGTTATFPTRIFVRGNGSLSGAHAFSTAGTAANPIYWVGCTGSGTTWTRIGNASSDSRPLLTCGTNQVTITGAFQTFEGLSFTGAQTGSANGQVYATGADCHAIRCRFASTASNANGVAANWNCNRGVFAANWVSATTTASRALNHGGTESCAWGNVVSGGAIGINNASTTGRTLVAFNIIYGQAGDAIDLNNGGFCICNTIQGNATASADGIDVGANNGAVIGNLIANMSGTSAYPINFTGSATTMPIMFNAWYNCTTDAISTITEAGDDVAYCFGNSGLLSAVANKFPNLDDGIGNANDFDLPAEFKALAFPGAFEAGGGYAYTGYLDHGAVQRQEAASGGGGGGSIIGSGVIVPVAGAL